MAHKKQRKSKNIDKSAVIPENMDNVEGDDAYFSEDIGKSAPGLGGSASEKDDYSIEGEESTSKSVKDKSKNRPTTDPLIDTTEEDSGLYGGGTNKNDRILEQMRVRMESAREHWRWNHKISRDAVSFAYESQWSAEDLNGRKKRPALELNMLPQFINHVKGNAIRNRASIHVNQTGGPVQNALSNATGSTKYTKSEIMEGLIRDISHKSKLSRLGTRAVQQAADGGISWLRVISKLTPQNPFEPEYRITMVRDRYSVLTDGNYMEDDMSDMKYAFVYQRMERGEFTARYKDAPPLVSEMSDGSSWWNNQDGVVVAEYWRLAPVKKTAILYKHDKRQDEMAFWESEIESVQDEILEAGYIEVERKESMTHEVRMFKTNGIDMLSEEIVWPGCQIPFVFVGGRPIDIGNKTLYLSVHHYACDAQRMHNYWMTAATERVAMAPKTKIMATADMLDGYGQDWENSVSSNKVVLYYQPDGVTGDKPQVISPPTMPTTELQIAMATEQAVHKAVGIYPPNLGQKSNETSGSAIDARSQQGDIGTLDFGESLLNAYVRIGEILVDVIPKTMSSNLMTRILLQDGSTDSVNLNHTVTDDESGKEVVLNNMLVSRFGIRVSAGPSYETLRQETARQLTELLRNDPEGFKLGRDIVVESMDIPNGNMLARRFKSALPRTLLTEEEQQTIPEPPPPQPTPEEMMKMEEGQRQQALDMEKEKTEQMRQENAGIENQIALAKMNQGEAPMDSGGGDLMESVKEMVAEQISDYMNNNKKA